jgi:transposase
MAFESKREKLKLTDKEKDRLWKIIESGVDTPKKVERARILIGYADGKSVSRIASELSTNRPKVERCIDKALQFGVLAALGDLPRRGRPQKISDEARAWLRQLHAKHEDWTIDRLAEYARQCGEEAGYKGIRKIGKGTVSKILSKDKARNLAKAEVLYLCEDIELNYQDNHPLAILVVAIDLTAGLILAVKIHEQYDTEDFIQIMDKYIDTVYHGVKDIRLFLNPKKTDLTSGEIKQYLKSKANRFKFEFMPSNNQAANLAETLILKMTKNLLKQIRVTSCVELEQRIKEFIQ